MSLSRRWFAWWYLSIGVGFLLLAAQRLLIGGRPALIVLRLVIAAAFLLLAWLEFRRAPSGPSASAKPRD